MLTCNLMGGLGNQLFQIFTVISYALEQKKKFGFLNVKELGGGDTTKRYTYWDSFFSKLDNFLMEESPIIHNIYREKSFEYLDIPSNEFNYPNVMLFGYFQSYLYFKDKYSEICDFLSINSKKINLLNNVLDYHTSNFIKNSVSIHFRLGDYITKPDYHPIMSYDYYKMAIAYILSNDSSIQNVLYFYEDDTDTINTVNTIINDLKNDYPNLIFDKASNKFSDWEQLMLMSCCRHNIIANSSYSWWGAYFNSNNKKIVCYPSVWFGPMLSNNNLKDLFPSDWVKI